MQPLFPHPLIPAAHSSHSWRQQCFLFCGTTAGTFYQVHLTPLYQYVGEKKNPPVSFQNITVEVFWQVQKDTGSSFLVLLQQKFTSNQATLHSDTLSYLPRRIWGWLFFWAKKSKSGPNMGIPKLPWDIDEAVASSFITTLPSSSWLWSQTRWYWLTCSVCLGVWIQHSR